MKNLYPGYKYLLLFLFLFVVLIISAVSYKIVREIATSSFKNNAFSILFVAKDSKYLYVDKNAKKVLFLAIGDVGKLVKGKDNLGASIILGIPINSIITEQDPPSGIQELTSSQREFSYLIGREVKLKSLNRYDIYKTINATKNSIKDNRVEKRVDLSKKEDVKEVEEYFVDSSVINEPVTVEIDNGTRINGLGNELAKVLGKQGYNVIAVRTVKEGLTSYIASEEKSSNYLNSLLGLTGFTFKNEKVSQAADVTIFLGDDLEAMLDP